MAKRDSVRVSRAAFAAMWHDPAATTDQIAAAFGMHRSTVAPTGQRLGLPPRKTGTKPQIPREPFASLWMAGVAAAEIAREIGVSRNYTCVLAQRFGLPKRRRGARNVITLADYRALQLRAAMAASASETAAAMRMAEMVDNFQVGRWAGRTAA